MKAILVLDMSYTLKMFRERHMKKALDSRKLGGYFERVISVHPLAGLFESGDTRFGDPVITELDDSHVFVEGKIGLSRTWRFVPPLNLLLAQIRLFRLLLKMSRKVKVDVVRIGDPYYLGLMGLFLARMIRVPLAIRVCLRYDEIFKVTGKPVMPRLFRFRWVEKVVERFVFKHCDLIAGANEDNMNYALENGGRSDVATVFRYGNLIHTDHWQEPSKRANADKQLVELGLADKKFIATVARLEPMKRTEDVIRVVAELIRRGHPIKCLIVGDGTSRKGLEGLTATLGVEDAVIFAGNRNQEWIATILPRAAVIISPHMGRALTEAALAGVPIIAYDYDWQREIVFSGQTGYLVPNKDWAELLDKTESILNNPASAKKMGENARAKILNMMDPEKLEIHEKNEYSKTANRFSMKKVFHFVPSMDIGGVEIAISKSLPDLKQRLDISVFYVKCRGNLDVGQMPWWRSFKNIFYARPDVVITSLWWAHPFGFLFRLAGIRWICFMHSSQSIHFIDQLVCVLAIWFSSEIATDSDQATAFVRSIKKTANVHIVPYIFSLPPEVRRVERVKNAFIYVGRSTKEKRMDLVSGFFRYLLETLPTVTCRFVIAGNIPTDVLNLIDTFGKRVVVDLNISNSDVLQRLCQSEYFVVLSDLEGFCMAAYEAVQAGCFIIYRDAGEIKNYVLPEQSLKVTDPGNFYNQFDKILTKRNKINPRDVQGAELKLRNNVSATYISHFMALVENKREHCKDD